MLQDKLATILAVKALLDLDTHAPKPTILEKVAGLVQHLPPELGSEAYEQALPRCQVVDSICRQARRLHEMATDIRTPSEHKLNDLVVRIRQLQNAHAGAIIVEELGDFDGYYIDCQSPRDNVYLHRDGDCPEDDPLLSMPSTVTRAEMLAVIRGWRHGYARGASDGRDEIRSGMRRLLQIA